MKPTVTVFEEGDANFFRVSDNKRWLARVQLNGELTLSQQRVVMARVVKSFNRSNSKRKP